MSGGGAHDRIGTWNQQTAPALTSYTYDAAGNRARKDAPAATTYYHWDAHDRLVAAEPVGGVVSYAYDGAGRRVTKDVGAETTRFVYDGDKVLQEADGAGDTDQQYLTTDKQYGDLVSAFGNGSARYYEADALGSTELLLDDAGAAEARFRYEAYGRTTEAATSRPGVPLPRGLPSPLGTTGDAASGETYTWVGQSGYRRETETDLYFLGSGRNGRLYDPHTIVFLSKDPAEERGGSDNLYLYCANDPINRTDPSGHTLFVTAACPGRQNVVTQALTLEIKSAFGPSEIEPGYQITPSGDIVERYRDGSFIFDTRKYQRVDLFKIPGDTWAKIRKSDGPHKQEFDSFFTSDRSVWTDARTPGAGVGHLEWETLHEHGPLGRLIEFVSELGGKLAATLGGIAEAVINKATAIAKIAFTRLSIAAIGEDKFNQLLEFIDRLFNGFGDVVEALVRNGAAILSNFFEAITKGTAKFVKTFPEHFEEKLGEWLGPGPSRLLKLGGMLIRKAATEGVDFGDVLKQIGAAVGFGWDEFLDIASSNFSSEELGFFAEFADNFATAAAGNSEFVNIDFKTFDLGGQKDSIAEAVKQAAISLFQQLSSVVVTKLVGKLLEFLGKFAVGGPILKLIEGLYAAIDTLIRERETIAKIFDTIAEAAKFVIFHTGTATSDVSSHAGNVFDDALAGGLKLVLKFVAKYFGIQDLPDRMQNVLDNLSALVESPFQKVIMAAKPLITAKFTGESSAVGDTVKGRKTPFTRPANIPGGSGKVWVDVDGTVWLSNSPGEELKPILDKTLKDPSKKATAENLIKSIGTSVGKVKIVKSKPGSKAPAPTTKAGTVDLNAPSPRKRKTAQSKMGAAEGKAVKEELIKIKKEVPELGNLLKGQCTTSTGRAAGTTPTPCPPSTTFTPRATRTVSYGGKLVERATGVDAVIVAGKNKRTNFPNSVPDWWNAFMTANPLFGSSWQKGHLLASQFGGPVTANNLAPQTFEVNQSVIKTCDNRIKEALACGCVKYSITVFYGDDPVRPTGFAITATDSMGVKIFDNIMVGNDTLGLIPAPCMK